jgi:hypothetical protein
MLAPEGRGGNSDRRIAKHPRREAGLVRPRRGVRGGAPAARVRLYSAGPRRQNPVETPLCHTGSVKWLVAGLTAAVLVLAGCGDYVGGDAKAGSRAGDPAFFFAGDVPIYGQTVSNNDKIALAYMRAIRRIDPCGFADRQALAKIGEIASLGTLTRSMSVMSKSRCRAMPPLDSSACNSR